MAENLFFENRGSRKYLEIANWEKLEVLAITRERAQNQSSVTRLAKISPFLNKTYLNQD
jgi:hypothetical protein